MKKLKLLSSLSAFALFLLPSSGQAQGLIDLEFDGFFSYSAAGDLLFGDPPSPLDSLADPTTGGLNLIGDVFYEFYDLDLAGIDPYTDYEWCIAGGIVYEGFSFYSDATPGLDFGDLIGTPDLIDLGVFSLADITDEIFGLDPIDFYDLVVAIIDAAPDTGSISDIVAAIDDGTILLPGGSLGLLDLLGPLGLDLLDELDDVHYSAFLGMPFGGVEFAMTAPLLNEIEGLEAIESYDVFFAGGFYLEAKAISATPVPEPSAYALIGAAALIGLIGIRRFKCRAKAA